MIDALPPGSEDELPFEFQQKILPTGKQAQQWEAIARNIQQTAPPIRLQWRRTFAIAASVVMLLGAAVWFYYSSRPISTNEYNTGYAQVKHITLPDGSKVVLNANSQLKLSANWSSKGDRQVWLEGEAYFEVEKKTSTHQKFIVHTKDLDVEVLGTRFNVNTRHEKALVSLEEGKIKLTPHKISKLAATPASTQPIEMKPGELVKLDTAAGIQLINEANIAVHSGWIRNEFHFNNTSLREIAILIKDTYGYNMVATDEQLLQRTVTGDLRAANLQELLDVLQLAVKLKMTVENKTITISRL